MHPPYRSKRKYLLQSIPHLFPGIDRVVVLSRTAGAEFKGEELLRNGTNYRLRNLILNNLDQSPLFKITNSSYVWLSPNELPFQRDQKAVTTTYHLFSEEYYSVLSLKIIAPNDEVDLFYLFFRSDQSNFGISRLQGALDASRKALIGSLVLKTALLFYTTLQKQKEYIDLFTNVIRNTLEKESATATHTQFEQWKVDWIYDFLKTLPHQPTKKWQLPPETIQKLSSGNYQQVKKALIAAAQIASMLYGNEDEWVILPAFITLETAIGKSKQREKVGGKSAPRSLVSEGRMAKAIQWLDNIEKATATLVDSGEDPTGSAVGQLLDRPISAPAITDWLRNNQKRVLLLLDKHPDKWGYLRNHFRPLINIIDRETKIGQTG